jgi:hypothetical protein
VGHRTKCVGRQRRYRLQRISRPAGILGSPATTEPAMSGGRDSDSPVGPRTSREYA